MGHSDPLPDHVQGLCRALAQSNGQSVQLHETHISWVIVGGEEAYKLRKRLKLPFADFSKLRARRDDCFKELALNRRWAPELYLDVVAVQGSDLAPNLGGPGPVIDYAVRMKRLADGALLKQRIDASLVTPSDMSLLAQVIAGVHQAAPVIVEAEPGAGLRQVSTSLRSVLDQLFQQPMDDDDHRLLMDARTWVEAEMTRGAAWMQQRADSGFVRDCHGDLHVENVAWMDGGWLLFDGVEFDDGLRAVDVIGDLAFLTMDLKVHGREDLAFALLDAYLQQTGDYEGVKLLRLHEVHRALIRLLVGRLPGAHGDASSSKAYLTLIASAVRALHARDVRLVLMHGLSGSGKSVLSGYIAWRLPAIRARSDVERKRLFGMRALDDSSAMGQSIYTEQANQRTASRLLQCAEWALEGGWSFIADATFLRSAERDRFWQLAERLGCEVSIVHCEADLEGIRRRVRARTVLGQDASEATEDVLRHQMAVAEPLLAEELACTLTACTAHAIGSEGITAICLGILGTPIACQRHV